MNVAAGPSSATRSSPLDEGRSRMTTWPPPAMSIRVVASPRPDAPPVITATESRTSMGTLSSVWSDQLEVVDVGDRRLAFGGPDRADPGPVMQRPAGGVGRGEVEPADEVHEQRVGAVEVDRPHRVGRGRAALEALVDDRRRAESPDRLDLAPLADRS